MGWSGGIETKQKQHGKTTSAHQPYLPPHTHTRSSVAGARIKEVVQQIHIKTVDSEEPTVSSKV